jgi:membrane-associated phospholipid phosphatase
MRPLAPPFFTTRRCAAALLGAAWLTFANPTSGQMPDPNPAVEESEGSGWLAQVGSDVLDGGIGFGRDLWAVVSFPSRLDRGDWMTVGGVAVIGGALYAADLEITEATLRQAGHQPHDALRDVGDFFEPIGLMGNTNAYWLGGILVGYATGQEWLRAPARDLLVSHWIACLTRNPVRDLVGRRRPSDGEGARTFVRGEGTSFPSGHSSTIMQVATILSHHIDRRWASVLLYGAAASVVFQRVDDEKHWASDAWVGAAWGWGVARTVIADRSDGTSGAAGPALVLSPRPGGLGLGVRIPLR